MKKPLNEFGGWLRFFWVINLLSLIFLCLSVIANFLSYMNSGSSTIYVSFIITLLTSSLAALLTWYILRFLKKQDPAIPIKSMFLLIASVVVILPQLFFKEKLPFNLITYSNLDLGFMNIFTLVWIRYFQKSKRVKAYYGKNAVLGNLQSSEQMSA